jgi:predicted phosphodiesterase
MDRFAAIADVHGHRRALEAVPEDIARRNIRTTVNLGDNLFGPLDPSGTANLLIPLNLPGVSGNRDHDPMPISAAHQDWLDSLPSCLELPALPLFHGTPESDTAYLLETVHESRVTLATPAEIATRPGKSEPKPLLLCGHTHIPRVVMSGETLTVNPGSVGLQAYTDDAPLPHLMETGSPHARYAALERTAQGWHVEQIQLGCDWETAARCAEQNNRLDWAFRLRSGRAL